MKRVEAILAATLAITLAGCVLRGKPKTVSATNPPPPTPTAAPAPPPPAPKPLSVPQTNVQLPAPQPLTPEAAASTEPPDQPPLPPPQPRPSTRQRTPAASPRNSEPATPAVPQGPPAPQPTDERPPIGEALAPEEQAHLREESNDRRTKARQLVDEAQKRQLTARQKGLVERIVSFVTQSEDLEKRGDLRQAYELAERALVLARDLQQ